jgi:acyl dehydratase
VERYTPPPGRALSIVLFTAAGPDDLGIALEDRERAEGVVRLMSECLGPRMMKAVGLYRSEVWPGGMPEVGQTAQRSPTVTADDIVRFTEISGDRNPLHYDVQAARATPFGEIIVQGGVTSAILNALVAEDLPGPDTVFLEVNWRFKAPVRPGDTITGFAEVLEARADKPITKLRTRVTRGDGTVVLEGDAVCYTMPMGRSG